MEPAIRVATLEEANAIDLLMKASVRDIFPGFHNQRQTESSVKYVSAVDHTIIGDGTYFVIEAAGELIACGGWSRRGKLYSGSAEGADDGGLLDPATQAAHVRAMFVRADWTRRGLGTRILEACEQAAKTEGFRRLDLMATMPGVPLYESYGFRVTRRPDLPLKNGERIAGALMEKAIDKEASDGC